MVRQIGILRSCAAFGAAIVLSASGARAFGTVNFLGQQAEHEMVTRTALQCHQVNPFWVSEGVCFQPKSLDEIAGKKGTFGAVGAPDHPANREGSKSEAHCDNSRLQECRAYMNRQMDSAVAAARNLLHWHGVNPRQIGRIDDSQIPTVISCTYLRQKGRAKCNVLEHLGSILHAAQDFYAHSNWADEAGPGPITINNPRGLNRREIVPFLNIRTSSATIPDGLITGCFIPAGLTDMKGDKKCTTPSHFDLNKDKGKIDPLLFNKSGDPTLTTAGTARGKIGTNFHNAVAGAVLDTRDKIRIFRERLVTEYGADKGALMFCAMTHDVPKRTCPGG